MTKYFLGIDTGATKSHALITDENGRICGFSTGGSGNWEGVGWEGTKQVLTEIIAQATQAAHITTADIAGAGFGLAGFDWPEDRQPHEEIIRSIIGNVPFTLVNDVLIGLPAGTAAGWGVVVGAGTSCNSYGRNQAGKIGRAIGSSYLGDEYAGATEFVHRAVQMVARSWTQRGRETRLTEVLVAEAGANNVEDLLAGIMRGRYKIGADKAPLIFAIADEGDPLAQDLVQWAGFGLGDVANGVIRQLDIAEMTFDVVMSGSFFNGGALLQTAMERMVFTIAPQANFIRLTAPPVIGAVLLSMELVQLDTAVIRQHLIEQTYNLVQKP